MKKVCHLTTVHAPFDVRIFQKECTSLARSGYDVSLVAVHDRDETVDGVRVLALNRPKGRLERWRQTRKQCLERALESGAQLFHFHDPELISVGLALKAKGFKVIYDVHESHAESILDRAYLHPMLRRPLSRMLADSESKANARLDAIVAATPKIANSFTNPRTVLVQNYPKDGELVSAESCAFAEREPALAYLGGVSDVRGAREMVAALHKTPGLRLIIVGEFSSTALREELAATPGWDQVECLGWQDRQGVGAALSRCIGGVVLFHPLRNHIESQPNKLFEYMSAGLPVLASDFAHWQAIVNTERCGILVDPLNVDQIANAMKSLFADRTAAEAMGARGKAAVETKYNWTTQEQALLGLYASLLP